MKEATYPGARGMEYLAGRADLLDTALADDGDAVGEREGLCLVMGDEDGGQLQLMLELLEERAGLEAEPGIEVGQRFVQQQYLGACGHGAGQGHALLLPAGELTGAPFEELLEGEARSGLPREVAAFTLFHAGDPQGVGDVVCDVHMREEGVVLEHHGDAAFPWVAGGHVLVADVKGAFGDRLEAGDGAQEGGLATARGAQEGEELAGMDFEVDAVHAPYSSGVLLDELVQRDGGCHALIPPKKRKPYFRLMTR